jgi:hypothetical protein
MQINLQGVILDLLTDLFIINDGFSAGEKLTQIEKTAKKRFYDMSDEQLYNALTETTKCDYYSDDFEKQ